jgi:murein DD-endopeptidase MepM/ murein hydrolase activator NlpD
MNCKIKKTILAVLLLLFMASPLLTKADVVSDLQQQIQDKLSLIKELEQKVGLLQKSIQNTKNQQESLKKQIQAYEEQINELGYEIKLTSAKITETNLQILRLDENIKIKEDELQTNKTYLVKTIRTINEYDQETPFEIILKNNTFSEFLDQAQYIENLQREIQIKIQTIKEIKTDLDSQKSEQEKYKGNLIDLNKNLKGKTLVLDSQQENKEDLLSTTKNQEKKYQTQMKELLKQQQDVQKEIYELEAKLRNAIDPSSVPAPQKGLLSWPSECPITQGYGSTAITGFINNVYNFHNGIDLGAKMGTPIKAAADGLVVGVGNDGKYAYGKWIAINHQNGLITLYGHFSVQSVKSGQSVKRGEVIGYSGNSGFSTGPHLHFTVYAANNFSIVQRWYGALPLGGSINPFSYLE